MRISRNSVRKLTKRSSRKSKFLTTFNLILRFKPEINPVSQYIVEGDPEYQNLTLEDRMRKLAIVDKERQDCKLEYLRKQEEEKYPFKPNINPVSRMIIESKNQKSSDAKDLSDITKREQRLL